MYTLIFAIVLALLGFVLLFAPKNLLPKETDNLVLHQLRKYHQFIGILFIGVAYYLYSFQNKKQLAPTPTSTPTFSSTESEEILPSYEEATSEILK
jgi:cytochrome b subunit of formate dehydrogenase